MERCYKATTLQEYQRGEKRGLPTQCEPDYILYSVIKLSDEFLVDDDN